MLSMEILLLEYVIPTALQLLLLRSDLIVDHKNNALSCKFNRSVHVVMEMSSRTKSKGPPAGSWMIFITNFKMVREF